MYLERTTFSTSRLTDDGLGQRSYQPSALMLADVYKSRPLQKRNVGITHHG